MFCVPTVLDENFPAEHKHCINCILINCKEDRLCSLVNCDYCYVRLHKCKLNDHIENICRKAPCKCPNTVYGCQVRLRRELISKHITFCCASLVFCPFVRNRQFYSLKAKKLLKLIAKNGETVSNEIVNTQEDIDELNVPDIAISLIDQKILTKFFQIPRAKRNTLCPAAIAKDFIRQNSLVIESNKNRCSYVMMKELSDFYLSSIPIKRKNFFKQKQGLDSDYFDSSDEEREKMENKNKKIREPFAGCSMCKLDPGSQHLHQLGSMNIKDENDNFKQREKNILKLFDNNSFLDFLPEFYRKRGLFISPIIPFLGIVLGEEYLSLNYPIFGCSACFIPRSQFNSHYTFHNIFDESPPYTFFARCPNWQRGCSFKMSTLTPYNGNGIFRFNSFLSTCVYEPMPQIPLVMQCPSVLSSGLLFAELPTNFYLLISRWLDDASLRTLSVTCRRMHELLPNLLFNRLSVEIKWRKKCCFDKNGADVNRFVENGFHEYFSSVQNSLPSLKIQPQGQIIDHLQNCAYQDVYDLGIEPIDLKKFYGKTFFMK